MNAQLQMDFKKGFLLTEEHLVKLSDVVHRRLSDAHIDTPLTFKVYQVDGALFEVEKYDLVTCEENSKRNAVKRLELLSDAKPFSLKLIFDPKEFVDLSIESDNKDFAYLLFSDIKEYLTSEVLKFRSFTFYSVFSSKFLLPVVALILPIVIFWLFKERPSTEQITHLLSSTDIHEKLNFLVESAVKREDPGKLMYALLVIFGLFVAAVFFGSLLDKAFPRNIFYWGKAIANYDRFVRIREKVIWGIVVAFLIGVTSAVVVDYFKPISFFPGKNAQIGRSK